MVPASAPSVCYVVDTRASQFTVQAFASGLAAAVAHSPKIAIRDWDRRSEVYSWHLDGCLDQGPGENCLARGSGRDEGQRPARASSGAERAKCSRRRGSPRSFLRVRRRRAERQKDDLYRLKVQGRLDLHGVVNDHSICGSGRPRASTARVLMANLNCSRPITAFGSLQSPGAR